MFLYREINPDPRPCFLTDRIQHARYVLSSCIHPFVENFEDKKRPFRMNYLPDTLIPPLPLKMIDKVSLKELKEFKTGMYREYCDLYWKRALEKIRAERGCEGEVVDDYITRYIRGYVHRGVYSLYNKYVRSQPLVSESAMETVLDTIPLKKLGFFPLKTLLTAMELSPRDLSVSIHEARENAAYYWYLLHLMIRHFEGDIVLDLEGVKHSMSTYLEVTAPKLSDLFNLAMSYLKRRGADPDALHVIGLTHHAFVKFCDRLRYVYLVLEMHDWFDTYVVGVMEDLERFQYALRSVYEWNRGRFY